MKIGMLVLFINMFRYIVYIYFYYLGCFLVLWPNVIFRKYLTIFTEYTYLPIFISIKHKIRVLAFRALLSAHPILTKKKKSLDVLIKCTNLPMCVNLTSNAGIRVKFICSSSSLFYLD